MTTEPMPIHKGTFAHCPKCHCEFSTDRANSEDIQEVLELAEIAIGEMWGDVSEHRALVDRVRATLKQSYD